MPLEPSVTSACEGPRLCTFRYWSALLPNSFERPGPKSVSPAMYCSGVKVVFWCMWIVDMCYPFRSRDFRDSESSRSGGYCSYWLSLLGGPELLSVGGAVAVTLRRWVVPNVGRQLILERCIHGVAEQFQGRIWPEGNSALHNQPLLVVHDDLQALELVTIHGAHPAQEGGALIELELGSVSTETTRGARLSKNRRDDFPSLDRPHKDRAIEYDVFGK